jgi:hypothetical protein
MAPKTETAPLSPNISRKLMRAHELRVTANRGREEAEMHAYRLEAQMELLDAELERTREALAAERQRATELDTELARTRAALAAEIQRARGIDAELARTRAELTTATSRGWFGCSRRPTGGTTRRRR